MTSKVDVDAAPLEGGQAESHAGAIQAVADAVLLSEGDLAPAMRHAAALRAGAVLRSGDAGSTDLPAELREVVDKIALRAYTVTDEDIAGLLEAGYSEDAVFEAILSTAVGAGMARLAIGLDALREA